MIPRYQWTRIWTISYLCVLVFFSWVQSPVLRENPNYEQIVAPMRDSMQGLEPETRAEGSLVAQDGNQNIFHIEGDHYKAQIQAESKGSEVSVLENMRIVAL